jgi:hypothetical protein
MTEQEAIKQTPVAPEPPAIDRIEHTPPITLYRNSWRHGWAEGYRAALHARAAQQQVTAEAIEQALQAWDDGDQTPTEIIDALVAKVVAS